MRVNNEVKCSLFMDNGKNLGKDLKKFTWGTF